MGYINILLVAVEVCIYANAWIKNNRPIITA